MCVGTLRWRADRDEMPRVLVLGLSLGQTTLLRNSPAKSVSDRDASLCKIFMCTRITNLPFSCGYHPRDDGTGSALGDIHAKIDCTTVSAACPFSIGSLTLSHTYIRHSLTLPVPTPKHNLNQPFSSCIHSIPIYKTTPSL